MASHGLEPQKVSSSNTSMVRTHGHPNIVHVVQRAQNIWSVSQNPCCWESKGGAFQYGYVIFLLAGIPEIALDSHGIPQGFPCLGDYVCVCDTFLWIWNMGSHDCPQLVAPYNRAWGVWSTLGSNLEGSWTGSLLSAWALSKQYQDWITWTGLCVGSAVQCCAVPYHW